MDRADFVKTENKWCEPQVDTIKSSLKNAEKACNDARDCKMIYDLQSTNKTFGICGASSVIKNSEVFGSSLYAKCNFLIDIQTVADNIHIK